MRLERSADRDKLEILNNYSADDAQSEAERIPNRLTAGKKPLHDEVQRPLVFHIFTLQC